MIRLIDHSYIVMTVVFTVYSQLIMRWQVGVAGPLPVDASGKLSYILVLMLNPWVLSGIISTFLAGVSWMLAMTKFELSYAYPFISLNYILVVMAGFIFFNESINVAKLMGSALVILGIIVVAKG